MDYTDDLLYKIKYQTCQNVLEVLQYRGIWGRAPALLKQEVLESVVITVHAPLNSDSNQPFSRKVFGWIDIHLFLVHRVNAVGSKPLSLWWQVYLRKGNQDNIDLRLIAWLLHVSILGSSFVCAVHPQCKALHWQESQDTLVGSLERMAGAISYWSLFILTLFQAVLC